MRKTVFVMLAMALVPFCAFAVDGVVLINQSTVTAAGGFPYVISQPGSYRLTGNLTVASSADGIQITASNVTLDLNGFSITGPPTFNTTPGGIVSNGSAQAVTVRNGSISGFLNPIRLQGSPNLVEDLIILKHPLTTGSLTFNSGVFRRVVNIGGSVGIKCPAVVVECVTNSFFTDQSSSTACSFSSNSGFIN